MLKRIIPKIDIKNNYVIKTINLEGLRALGSPIFFCNNYFKDGADEIFIKDATASFYNYKFDMNVLSKISHNLLIPICAGGNIKDLRDARKFFYFGADKINLNSLFLDNPIECKNIIKKFGSSNTSLSVDYYFFENKYYQLNPSNRQLYDFNLIKIIQKAEDMGFGEIILTNVLKEGSLSGMDLLTLEKIKKFTLLPLIGCGGIGSYNDVLEVFKKTDINGVGISSLFHYNLIKKYQKNISSKLGNYTYVNSLKNKTNYKFNEISKLKKYLKQNGIKSANI